MARARAKRVQGRGRLSSIDQLPEEAAPDIEWAMGELRERARLQIDILEEFNARLADRGIAPISASAFNRHSLRLARIARRLAETRDIAKVLNDRLPAGASDETTVMIAETIKTLIFELLDHEGANFTPKATMEMARALQSLVSAQKLSGEARRRLQAEFAAKVDATVDKVAVAAGLSAERAAEIRRDVLGVGK